MKELGIEAKIEDIISQLSKQYLNKELDMDNFTDLLRYLGKVTGKILVFNEFQNEGLGWVLHDIEEMSYHGQEHGINSALEY